jgi:hypothetical protein
VLNGLEPTGASVIIHKGAPGADRPAAGPRCAGSPSRPSGRLGKARPRYRTDLEWPDAGRREA